MSFLVVGEALVDLISEPGSWRFEATAGGGPLNVAVGLAASGASVRLATEIGTDLFGTELATYLRRYGVDDRDLLVTDQPTGLAFARLASDGTAQYDFRFTWRWAGQPDLTGVSCLHVGSLGTLLPPGAAAVNDLVDEARRGGVPVSYDPNPRPAAGDRATLRARVEAMVPRADIVKVSEPDLALLYPDTPPSTAAAGWAARGPRLVVLTRGGDGAVALCDGRRLTCQAPQVPVVDTVGAGDAFTAGLLATLATAGPLASPDRHAVATALRHAVATATAACLRRGAAPAGRDTVAALLNRTGPAAD